MVYTRYFQTALEIMLRVIVWTARVFFATVFIFSGFVKAIDPLGVTYKFQDFFVAFGMESFFPVALPLAILLSTLEFVVGFAFLFGLKLLLFAPAGLALMAVFTPATIYIALTNPVPHCGCFGDAIVISNQATAYKNGLLLAAAAVVFYNKDRIRASFPPKTSVLSILAVVVLISGLSVYCLKYLPIIDFRPWKVGSNMAEWVASPPDTSGRIFLVFENRETGETRNYPADDYPWDDPEWADLWQYKTRLETTKPQVAAPIGNFDIVDEWENDRTGSIITDPGYLYLVVAYNLDTANNRAFEIKLAALAEEAQKSDYAFIVLTASPLDIIDAFKEKHAAGYPIFHSDERELKTIIRSNPGLVLMKDGMVLGKWPHTNMPMFDQIINRYKK